MYTVYYSVYVYSVLFIALAPDFQYQKETYVAAKTRATFFKIFSFRYLKWRGTDKKSPCMSFHHKKEKAYGLNPKSGKGFPACKAKVDTNVL